MLLDAVSRALRDSGTIKLSRLPRMADFAIWVEAAASAFGWERESFLTAYLSNRAAANDLADSMIGRVIAVRMTPGMR